MTGTIEYPSLTKGGAAAKYFNLLDRYKEKMKRLVFRSCAMEGMLSRCFLREGGGEGGGKKQRKRETEKEGEGKNGKGGKR